MNKRFLLLGLIMFAGAAWAQQTETAKIDTYLETLEANNKFMGSVCVYRDGVQLYSKAVGFANIEQQKAATAQSQYRIGSISKTFTATMVFQAIEAGKLTTDQTIDKYFPTIKNGDKITVGHLMSHRSGIHNFTADEKYPQWATQSRSREQMVETITAGGSDFEPDSKAQYSNSNYVLLSYILETIYAKPYGVILGEQITTPLSLTDTYLAGEQTRSNECYSYKYFDKWRIESKTNASVPMGAGGIVSTPSDIDKFAAALFGGKLLSDSSLAMMKTIRDGYGIGLFAVPFHTNKGLGHSGGIDGFHSMFIYFPHDKLSYCVLSNALNYNLNDIHIAVLSGLYGMPFEIPDFKTAHHTDQELDSYVGIYSCSQLPIKLTITKNGNSLTAQGTGQAAFPLEATARHKFGFAQAGIIMEFNPTDKTLILKQGGGTFLFNKE